MTNYYDRACAALPELQALIDGREHALNQMKTQHDTGVTDRNTLTNQAYAAVMAGEPVPADLGERLHAADRAVEWWTARKAVILNIANNLKSEREVYEQTNGDMLIEVLQPELARILDEAEAVIPRLRGATSADAAIQAGGDAVAAWMELGSIAEDYASLRSTHWRIMRTGWERHEGQMVFKTSEYGIFTALRGAEELWPDTAGNVPPWPIESTLRPTDPPTATREFLLWANKNREHVWLPTISQVLEEHRRYREATKPEVVKLSPEEVRRNERWRALQHSNGGQGIPIN